MNYNKTTHWERILIICVFAALLCSMVISSRLVKNHDQAYLRSLSEGWFMYVDDDKVPVTLPCDITVAPGENLELRYNRLTTVDGSTTLCTKGAVYDLQIKMGNNILYSYDDTGFKRNIPMRAKLDCLAILPENPSGTDLILQFKNQGDNVFHISPVLVGRSGEVLQQLFYNDLFMILGVLTMMIIGVVCMGAHIYLKYMHIQDSRLGSASVFLLLVSFWCLLDSSITQQINGLSPNMSVLAIYCFMAMPIPTIHFVRKTANLRRYRRIDFLLMACYANILTQAALHILFNSNYIDLVFITHLIQGIVCMVSTHLLAKEYRETRNWEILAVLQSVFILDVAMFIEMIIYWVFKSPYYGFILQMGVLAFVIRLLCAILVSMASNIQFKAEAMVYKRLSREDRLTGLGNRRGFDDYFAELESTAGSLRNALLIFLDVNGLKIVNDRFGHRAGDELIIGSARCLSAAFSSLGSCYRIGGDEFAVIILNPEITVEECAQKLDDAIAVHNGNNHWKLSIAWGTSFLRDDRGNLKRTSDWMFEADQAMYAMKSEMKAKHPELVSPERR